MVEMLVTMVVLSMMLGLFSTAVLGLVRSVRKQSGVIDAQQATRTAFLILDKQIRYASVVSAPVVIGTDQWIAWKIVDPGIPVGQSATQSRCYQWRASSVTGQLMYRSYVVPTSGGVTTPAWVPVASGLVIGSQPVFTTSITDLQSAPFSLPQRTIQPSNVQVGVAMNVSSNGQTGRSTIGSVFTALNSSSSTSATCREVPWI
jgi:hypothetical protein